jgi:hypothetical protein
MLKIGSFVAKDQRGRKTTIVIWSEREIVPPTFSSPAREVEIVQHLRTTDGKHVNREDRGKYQVVETGESLTSDDPSAI